MNIPQPVKLLHIVSEDGDKRAIRLNAAPEMLETIRQHGFGSLRLDGDTAEHELTVSPIWDFDEVAEWLRAQGE